MYSWYVYFPGDFRTEKRFFCPSFFSDISNVFFDSFKVILHQHLTREIYGYPHNFCNKKVRELAEKSGQYFSCDFHNGFRFDTTFLTKGLQLSLWQTQDVCLLGSGLTTLKSYTFSRHAKSIDSVKYYQQPLAKLARSTDANEKKNFLTIQTTLIFTTADVFLILEKKIQSLLLSTCLLEKGVFPTKQQRVLILSLSLQPPKMVISRTSKLFTLGSGMKEFLKENGRGVENCLKCSS